MCFFDFIRRTPDLGPKSIKFLMKKKKSIKSEKYADFGHQPGKLASNLKMNIRKMGKTLKSEKFMIIFVFQSTYSENYDKFLGFKRFPIFVIFIFKLDANSPGLRPKSTYF